MNYLLRLVVWLDNKGKRLAIKLVKLRTGKSVLPKHLLSDMDAGQYWYLPYIRGRLLDVGCGTGEHTIKAARYADYALGIDRNIPEDAGHFRDGAWFLAWDVEKGLPGSYDVVMCLDVLEHVAERQLLLGCIRSVLALNGRLLLSVPQRSTSWKRLRERHGVFAYADPDHKIEYSHEEIRDELKRAGFRVIGHAPSVLDMPGVGLIDCIGACSLWAYKRLTSWRRRMAVDYPQEAAGFNLVCRVG